jgi:hypothetical protein
MVTACACESFISLHCQIIDNLFLGRPINTYNGKGVTKMGLSKDDREAHAVIYMSDTKPELLAEERRYLTKNDIAVDKAADDQRLHPMSRLNFNKIYTVEHNVKVMDVGTISKDSMISLITYWSAYLNG